MYNVYSENDYLLAFLYRATSLQLGVAGLQEIADIEGVENLNLSEEVQGHLRYPKLIDKILARCDFPIAEGVGPIEREEDEIILRDEDLGRTGTLIELDSLTPAEPRRPVGTADAKAPLNAPGQPPQRTTVVRAATSSLPAGGHDPLGFRDPLSDLEPPPPYQFRSTTMPALPPRTLSQTPTSPQQADYGHHKSLSGELPNVKYGGVARDMALGLRPAGQRSDQAPLRALGPNIASAPALSSQPSRHSLPQQNQPLDIEREDEDEDDYDDEDEGGGIKMVDNDSDFEYLDPTPIED